MQQKKTWLASCQTSKTNLSYCKSWHRGRGGTIWLKIRVGVQTIMKKRLGLPIFLATTISPTYPQSGYSPGSQHKMVRALENVQLINGRGQEHRAVFQWDTKVQGLGPGPPQVSGTTTVFSIWLGLLYVCLIKKPLQCFQNNSHSVEYSYWIKYMQLQIKKKKKTTVGWKCL